MKKLIVSVLALICIWSLDGCNNRSIDKGLNEMTGTIAFYSEPIKEAQNTVKPITGQLRVELDEEQANRISAIIGNIDEWVDDHSVDRLAYYFDGEFELANSEFAYYFAYEYNVIYCDHYFAEITDEEMQFIKDMEPAEQIGSITRAEVEEIAKAQCKVNYDYMETDFDDAEKVWRVGFWENNSMEAAQRISIDMEGNVLGILYAE